jgi:hypothetical protein
MPLATCSSRRLLTGLAGALTAATLTVPAGAATAGAALATDGNRLAPVVVQAPGPMAGTRWAPSSVLNRTAPEATPATSAATSTVSAPNAAALNVAPVTAPAGSYAFMAEPTPGNPIRWNPCASVHWVFNPAHAPVNGLYAVRNAIARVAATTGLTFVYDGTVSSVPTSSYLSGSSTRPLLVGWSTATESTLLANQPSNLVGMTQSTWTRDAAGAYHITSGVVALSSRVTAPSSGPSSWYTFALHELGHAVGLAHASDRTQIMYPSVPSTRSDYNTGDLAGLRRLGSPC